MRSIKWQERVFRGVLSLLLLVYIGIIASGEEVRYLCYMLMMAVVCVFIYQEVKLKQKRKEDREMKNIERSLAEQGILGRAAYLMRTRGYELRIRGGENWTATYLSTDGKVTRMVGVGRGKYISSALESAGEDADNE